MLHKQSQSKILGFAYIAKIRQWPLVIMVVMNILSQPSYAAGKTKWLVYRNPEAGIQINYPQEAKLNPKFQNNYFANSYDWRYHPEHGKSKTGTPIISIDLLNLNNIKMDGNDVGYYRSEMRIGMSMDKQEVLNCTKGYSEVKRVNGNIFYITESDDTAMTQALNVVSYRKVYKQVCYAFEIFTAYRSGINKPAIEKKANLSQKINTMIASIKFTH